MQPIVFLSVLGYGMSSLIGTPRGFDRGVLVIVRRPPVITVLQQRLPSPWRGLVPQRGDVRATG
ncbi:MULTISPECIES: hypothetical protein [unclassified Kitasatospora]